MKNKASIQIRTPFNTPKENLWNTLTEVEKMKKWYFNELEDFEPKLHFKTAFKIEYEGQIFTHKWTVFKVTPYKTLAYYWKYEEYEGNSTVTFEIEESPEGVELILTAEILEAFPDIEVFSHERMVKGWNGLIYDRLKPYLEKSA